MEPTSIRVILFDTQLYPEAVRPIRLRGGGGSAPGKRLFGSEEEAVRLRGENRLQNHLIISALRILILAFRALQEQ